MSKVCSMSSENKGKREGSGNKNSRKLARSTIKELFGAMDSAIEDSVTKRGAKTLLVIDPVHVFNIEVQALRFLIDEKGMDGVVLTLSRPARVLRMALDAHLKSEKRPYYVDPLGSISGYSKSGNDNSDHGVEGMIWTSEQEGAKTFWTPGPFDGEVLYSAVETAMHALRSDAGGGEYFVYVDDLMGLEHYLQIKETNYLATAIKDGLGVKDLPADLKIHKFVGLSRIEDQYYSWVYERVGPSFPFEILCSDSA